MNADDRRFLSTLGLIGATCLALAALIVAVAMLVHLIGPHL